MAEYDFFAPNAGFDDMGANTPRGRQELYERGDVDPESFLKKSMLSGYSKASVQEYVRTMNQNSSQMRMNFERQIHDLSEERAKIANECALLRSQIDEIEQQKKSFEDQLVVARDHYDHHQEQIDSLSRAVEEERGYAEEVRGQLESLKGELDRKDLDLKAKEEEISALNRRIQDLSSEIASKEGEIENLVGKVRDSQDSAQREELQREMSLLRERLLASDAQRKEIESEKHELEEQIAARDARIVEFEARFGDFDRETADLGEQNLSLKERIEELNLELERLNKRNDALEERSLELDRMLSVKNEEEDAAHKALKMEREKLEIQAKALREESACLHREFSDRSEELERSLAKSLLEKEEIGEKYSALHERFTQAVEKCDQLESEKEALSDLLGVYQAKEREHTLVLRKCEEYGKTVSGLQDVIAQLVQEMEGQLARFKEMSDEQSAYREKVRQMARDKTELQMKNVALLEKIDSISLDLDRAESERRRLAEPCDAAQGPETSSMPLDCDSTDTVRSHVPNQAKEAVRRARDISNLYILDTKNAGDLAPMALEAE